jgi:RNA polymerase sigma-70 factor (ECF subfamily)
MEKDFECYYREYSQRVFNVAYRILRDYHAAEEVTQETFMRAWAALQSSFPPEKPGPWLLRVATNAALDEIRHHKRQVAVNLATVAEAAPGPEEATIEEAVRNAVWTALERVKPRYRSVLALRADSLPPAEVAAALGISPAHERVLFRRALTALRRELLRPFDERRLPAACRQCRRILPGALADAASPHRQAVDAHLTVCPRCMAVAAAFRDSYYGVGLLPVQTPPASLGLLLAKAAHEPIVADPPAGKAGPGLLGKMLKWLTAKKLAAVVTAGVVATGLAVGGYLAGHREPPERWQMVAGSPVAYRPPAPPANAGFETGSLDGWLWSCSTSRLEAARPYYDVAVDTGYAHGGEYGCRLAVAARSGAADVQIGQTFADASTAYTVWLRPEGGDPAHTEVLVVIQDLSTDPTGRRGIRYRGFVARPPREEPGDVSFRLQWGHWEAYRFDFARDYRARYGSQPGPHRVVGIVLRQRAGGGPVGLWVDDFTGAR